jgi:alkylated DNA repair dioxygenase AlkB
MIDGLKYFPDFISSEEEKELLSIIDAQEWNSRSLKRRVQHYGYVYDYTKRKIDSSSHLGPLPEWLGKIHDKISTYFEHKPDQAIVNEYTPGQGIGPHIDCVPCFGPVVASLSLNSPCSMVFGKDKELKSLWLEPRSLLVLTGPARYEWTHQIHACKWDFRFEGTEVVETVNRQRRVSITFRTVIKDK